MLTTNVDLPALLVDSPLAFNEYRAAHPDEAITLRGANLVGSPQEVIEKILMEHQLFGMTRFLIQFSVGTMPHDAVMRSIELLGTKVAPVVRKETSEAPAVVAAR